MTFSRAFGASHRLQFGGLSHGGCGTFVLEVTISATFVALDLLHAICSISILQFPLSVAVFLFLKITTWFSTRFHFLFLIDIYNIAFFFIAFGIFFLLFLFFLLFDF